MPDNTPQFSVPLETLNRKHETRNPSVRWIVLAAGLVVVLVAACLGIIWLTMGWLTNARPLDPTIQARGVITAPDQRMLERFPSPHLQVDPHDELLGLLSRENAELNSYGWMDRTNGIIRIPIGRAMDLLAQRGLPTRATNAMSRTGKSSLELIRERSQTR